MEASPSAPEGNIALRAVSQEVLMMEKRTSVYREDKRRILFKVGVVSASFALLFTAFQALSNLQSSINIEKGLGTYSLATIYAFLVFSCMFVPSAIISRIGCKWTMCISILGYILYFAANFYPKAFTLYPTSAIVGFSAAPLWSAKCSYLTSISIAYARMSRELPEVVISRFFGIFFGVFQFSTVIGNALSSIILSLNASSSFESGDSCGVVFCPWDAGNRSNLARPDGTKLYALLSVYVALGILAFIVLSMFLSANDEGGEIETSKFDPRALVATFLQMKKRNQLLLIPITIFSGLEQGYLTSEYTQAYISCALGVWMVGFVMICYGVCDALSSILLARASGVMPRAAMFLLGAALHASCMIGLILWKPSSDDPTVIFFVIAGIWGVADAVWQTQINAFYGAVFSENSDAAFANYRLWESVGFIIAFSYSHNLCARVKTYVLFVFLLLGLGGYIATEVLWRKEQRTPPPPEPPPPPERNVDEDVKTEM